MARWPRRGEPGLSWRAISKLPASGLELGVPVEIVHPALMQIVRRKLPSVLMQIMDRWLVGPLTGPHARLRGQPIALEQIAGRAGRHHVRPDGLPALRARHHMVEGQILAAAAILAGEAVTQEHVEAREGRMARRLDI